MSTPLYHDLLVDEDEYKNLEAKGFGYSELKGKKPYKLVGETQIFVVPETDQFCVKIGRDWIYRKSLAALTRVMAGRSESVPAMAIHYRGVPVPVVVVGQEADGRFRLESGSLVKRWNTLYEADEEVRQAFVDEVTAFDRQRQKHEARMETLRKRLRLLAWPRPTTNEGVADGSSN